MAATVQVLDRSLSMPAEPKWLLVGGAAPTGAPLTGRFGNWYFIIGKPEKAWGCFKNAIDVFGSLNCTDD